MTQATLIMCTLYLIVGLDYFCHAFVMMGYLISVNNNQNISGHI